MAKMLEQFTIARAADGYLLTIEVTATFDQLDLITEELDRALDEDADDATMLGDEDAVEEVEEER